MNPSFDLSIILLVWNDRAFLPACLASLIAARGDLSLEIILIENGVTLQAAEYPIPSGLIVQHIHNATNRGVAPARNQGLHAAHGRYFLLLDVDTRVTPDALTSLVRFVDAHPDVGLAGARLEDADGNLQLSCRKLPTIYSKILRRIPTEWAQRALAKEQLAAYDHRTPREVDYVIGACQIIRREAYEQAGDLDERFFYGPEDVDYCIRMWRHGWRVMYIPQATAIHNEQRLTKQQFISKLTFIHALSLARYFWKYHYLFRPPYLNSPQTMQRPQRI